MNAAVQLSIFDVPIARRTDPESSKLAGDALTHSGARGKQKQLALDAVKAHPGRTSLELAERTGLCRFFLAKRLADLNNAGDVHKGALIRCAVSGNLACPWWLGPDPMRFSLSTIPAADAA